MIDPILRKSDNQKSDGLTSLAKEVSKPLDLGFIHTLSQLVILNRIHFLETESENKTIKALHDAGIDMRSRMIALDCQNKQPTKTLFIAAPMHLKNQLDIDTHYLPLFKLFDLIIVNWAAPGRFDVFGPSLKTQEQIIDGLVGCDLTLDTGSTNYLRRSCDNLVNSKFIYVLSRTNRTALQIPRLNRLLNYLSYCLLQFSLCKTNLLLWGYDLSNNRQAHQWKKREQAIIAERNDVVEANFENEREGVIATISCSNETIAFVNPVYAQRFFQRYRNSIRNYWLDLGSWEDLAICSFKPENAPFQLNEQLIAKIPQKRGLVLSTLMFNDFIHLEPWIEHYRNQGVSHFLLYYNDSRVPATLMQLDRVNEDITIIPWPIAYYYRNSLAGKPQWHLGQPAALHHSLVTCQKKSLGEAILYVDIDEYVVGSPKLSHLLEQNRNEWLFPNVWASCSQYPPTINSDVQIDVTTNLSELPRRKSMFRIQGATRRNNHGSGNPALLSQDHLMLHFGNLGTSINNDRRQKTNFLRINSLDRAHAIRQVFEKYEMEMKTGPKP